MTAFVEYRPVGAARRSRSTSTMCSSTHAGRDRLLFFPNRADPDYRPRRISRAQPPPQLPDHAQAELWRRQHATWRRKSVGGVAKPASCIAKSAATSHNAGQFTVGEPAILPFDWADPFDLNHQLTDEERLVRDTAEGYAQEKLQPRVTCAYLDERFRPRDHERDGRARPARRDHPARIWRRRPRLCQLRPDRPRGRARSTAAIARRCRSSRAS